MMKMDLSRLHLIISLIWTGAVAGAFLYVGFA
jgi:hypothetical protein